MTGTFEDLLREICLEIVDRGESVLAPGLMLRQPDDTIIPAFIRAVPSASEEDLAGWREGDLDVMSRLIQMPADVIEQRWPHTDNEIYAEALDRLGLDDDSAAEFDLEPRFDAWLDSFADHHLIAPERPEIQLILSDLTATAPVEPIISDADLQPLLLSPPVNAWLLLGSEASFITSAEVTAANAAGGRMLWTAPKQARPGDLAVIYFIAPRKAANIVGRVASHSFFDPSIEIHADAAVNPKQWWVELTDLREIPPIAYSDLQRLMDGHLILRGRPTNYLPPSAVRGLSDLVRQSGAPPLPIPAGIIDLPAPGSMTLEQWRTLSTGRLQLEKQVEEYVVEPMLRLALEGAHDLRVVPQYRTPVGVPDYVVVRGAQPVAVVEAKVNIRTARAGGLEASPDVAQLRRYIAHLDVPGILIDANRLAMLDSAGRILGGPVERLAAQSLMDVSRHLGA